MKLTRLPNPTRSPSATSRFAFALLLVAPAAAQTRSQAAPPAETAVVMDPFDVTSVQTDRYQASNTISGTAMNTLLKDVPMTINVITSEFLNDAIVGDLERALDFNSSVTQTTRGEISNQNAMFSLRGFRNRNILLDGVMGGDFIPRYLIDRIEVVKGPNTLYGQSDPGGLINMITKRPRGRDQTHLTARFGSNETIGGDIDVNLAEVGPGVGLRLLGSYESSDGFRWLDDRTSSFGAAIAEWKAGKGTRVRVLASVNAKDGNPSNRSALPFVIRPTDLNGDGDTLDNVGGVVESTARYNPDFIPWEFTSQTRKSEFEQDASYLQFNLQQSFGESVDVQYAFMRSAQENDVTFRAYNTFNAAGSVAALYQSTNDKNIESAHTLNTLLRVTTGPIKHHVIVGARNTRSKRTPEYYQLRPGTAAERAALNALEVGGRVFRHTLTKSDILSGTQIWNDDAPTRPEIRAAAFRFHGNLRSYEQVETYFVSDSFTLLEDRLRILAGLRSFEVSGWSFALNGTRGATRVSRDISHQVGINYTLSPAVILFANQATSFDPNGFDALSNDYFPAEESDAIEAGIKLDGLWRGRLSGSISWFRIDKVNVVRSDYDPFLFRNTTEITDDRGEGIDLELFVNLTPGWQTTVGYTHLNARTVRTKTQALGMRLEGAAPDRLTYFTTYSFGKGSLEGLRLGGGGIRAWGPIQQFGTSDSRLIAEDGYVQYNLFARYALPRFKRPTTVGVNVSNLTDEFFIRARGNSSTPREIIASIHTKF